MPFENEIARWLAAPWVEEEWKVELRTLAERDPAELTRRFTGALSFGTAGMRALVGAGPARLNTPNVKRLALMVARYLAATPGAPRKVAIAFDSRLTSKKFAQAAAHVFLAEGFEVLMPPDPQPVPLLSYGIRHYRCGAGFAVTASHNPPDYNGCKIYGPDGSQVCPPLDAEVLRHLPDWNALAEVGAPQGDVRFPADWLDGYLKAVHTLSISNEGKADFRAVYTPLHGAAGALLGRSLKAFGIEAEPVPEQVEPDGRFPTVESPNPENPGALDLGAALARRRGAHAVLATDPDGDRIGALARETSGGEFTFLDGNSLLCLLTDFYLAELRRFGRLPAQPRVITSVVSSPLHRKIGEAYGAEVAVSLTGFKWMAKILRDWETAGDDPARFVIAGEESHGVLLGHHARDKDGVLGASLVAEMLAAFRAREITPEAARRLLFDQYGPHHDLNLSIPAGKLGSLDDLSARRLLQNLERALPKHFTGTAEIARVHDYVTDPLPGFPAHPLVQWFLRDGTRISVRPSGTEPKLKLYLTTEGPDLTDCERRAQTYLEAVRASVMEATT